MGVELPPTTRYGWEEWIRRKMPTFLVEPTLENFVHTIFDRHPELRICQLVYKARMSKDHLPEIYRLVYAERTHADGCKITDQLYPAWGRFIKESVDLMARGFKPKSKCFQKDLSGYPQPNDSIRFYPEMNLMAPLAMTMEDGYKFFGYSMEDTACDPGRANLTELDEHISILGDLTEAAGRRVAEASVGELFSDEES
jgi:hypothetical protein